MKNRIIYQHIPKTAGNSLSTLIRRQFDRKKQFICGTDGVLNDFIALPQKNKDNIELLIGHVDYGIHKYFNNDSLYFTFLRDPVERVLSHYYFIKERSTHRYHQYALTMDIVQFLKHGIRPRMNNCMVRMLSGIDAEYGKCTSDHVKTAMGNLENHYAFVGFISNMEGYVQRLCERLNFEFRPIPVINQTKIRPNIKDVSPEVIDEIKKYNSQDIELYHQAYQKYSI